jgi:hypothetical protein
MGGNLSIESKDPDEPFLKDAKFFTKHEIQGLNVFPALLKDVFWEDLVAGFPAIRYLGYRGVLGG